MAFDQSTRNRLQRFVTDARTLLSNEFTRQLQNEYGLNPETGEVSELSKLTFLDDARRETARVLRETMAHYLAATPGVGKVEILSRIVREQAFTILNRMAALRMAEARGILMESIGNGYQSKGFQLYSYMAGSALGESGESYRTYIFSLFDEFSLDLKVLFDRFSSQGRLFPKDSSLLELLDLINHPEIESLWSEDETIGWIYQYFNSKEERKKMRDASQAPRNSRELAVRNQFFTPRYVVEFLTDNTLGRIWYEMTQGKTSLTESCRYLVRRPNEIFLKKRERSPEVQSDKEDLSQEELLKESVYVPFRPLKDPRDLKMLDPACGSMHFGLYAFDLFEKIYDEAWDLEASHGPEKFERSQKFSPLNESYDSKDIFLQDVSRLIIVNNIHGVDIDSRAVQIAGLSLWLRAQKSWQEMGVNADNRPQVQKSNIVCAEPMPGEKGLLKEFTASLKPRVIGQLVEIIFDKMQLAGEAGSLLKIEEEIQDAIKIARTEYSEEILRKKEQGDYLPGMAPVRQPTLFDFADLPDDITFWDQAEHKILDALSDYAEHAEGMDFAQKRLFAQDAAKGFAFIDLCRKRFDVVLMNPPFGSCSHKSKLVLKKLYPDNWTDLYSSFMARALNFLEHNGASGAITSNLWLSIKRQNSLRNLVSGPRKLRLVADLGGGVLDTATVDTALSVIDNRSVESEHMVGYYICRGIDNRELLLESCEPRYVRLTSFSEIPSNPFCFDLGAERIILWSREPQRFDPDLSLTFKGNGTFDNFRFLRTYWEINPFGINIDWIRYDKGGFFQPFFNPSVLLWKYKNRAAENRAFQIGKSGTDAQVAQSKKHWGKPGLCYSRATSIGFSPRILAAGHVVNDKSIAIIPKDTESGIGVLALLSSTHVQDLLYAFGYHRNIEKGALASLPLGQNLITKELRRHGKLALEAMVELESTIETSPVFLRPPHNNERPQYIDQVVNAIRQIDTEVSAALYGYQQINTLSKSKEQLIVKSLKGRFSDKNQSIQSAWYSYAVGVVYGRWNLDLVRSPLGNTIASNPTAELPLIQPGQEIEKNEYFHNGVMTMDKGHKLDLASNTDDVLSSISINTEGLREWMSKGFFKEHIAMYSQSGRIAPIYWPLQSSFGNYTLWLYYHCLNDQILYTCVNDFVDPKLKLIGEDTNRLRMKTHRSTQEDKELEKLINFELELADYKDELLKIAKFWKPNLDDGVQITAAPLWKLFQHKPWQKKLKQTWGKLEKGDYDWAHLAYSIWPDRVKEKCKTDKSLAIAHDLEALYEES